MTIKSVSLFLARFIGIYLVCLGTAVYSLHSHDPEMSAYQIGAAFRQSGLRDGLIFVAALLAH